MTTTQNFGILSWGASVRPTSQVITAAMLVHLLGIISGGMVFIPNLTKISYLVHKLLLGARHNDMIT
jgi:hypothetical protein